MQMRHAPLPVSLAYIKKNGRLRLRFSGIVQGVGFRPFLYRSAARFGLKGFVKNTNAGVTLEVEGNLLPEFVRFIIRHAPPLSRIEDLRLEEIPPRHPVEFEILASDAQGQKNVLIAPDIALCRNCRREMADPSDRRFAYPFTNCTDCGPRFSIIKDLPYDRPLTTMKRFAMCPDCRCEYESPSNRRYHAQPVSCPRCGPELTLLVKGKANRHDPLAGALRILRANRVLAVKGIGGFHLACRAASPSAVARLRRFKKRDHKPFALMASLEMIRGFCRVSAEERRLLAGAAAPIVLLRALPGNKLGVHVAPGQNRLGFMLPYSPLHRLLLEKAGEPLVMTSANLADEPIIFRDNAAELPELCDAILTHNRPIHAYADDSVSQVFEKETYFIRRSRGFVPLPISLPLASREPVLALGGMLKTTFTLLHLDRALVSQHIGDTESVTALAAEKGAIAHFLKLFALRPRRIVVDAHPLYPNRLLAADFPDAEIVEVQHHRAHIASLLAESEETGKVLGIALDGTGYGDDGTIWGGEFFVGDLRGLERVGHLQPLFLPGGDQATREPWRTALSLLLALPGGEKSARRLAAKHGPRGRQVLAAIANRRGGVMTSSCGRLFDGAAALLGIGERNSYEGELPSRLQAVAETARPQKTPYPFVIKNSAGMAVLNLLPAVAAMLADQSDRGTKARRFHLTLAHGLLAMAVRCAAGLGIQKVALSGGVFQNVLLLRMSRELLQKKGFQVLIHSQVPPNDGGLSLGQAVLAAMKYRKES
jgi:hydrogenase maturation protein HypF